MLTASIAANTVPTDEITAAQVSDSYPNLFTPAGFTVSLWGLIYVLLLGFCIYQPRDLLSVRDWDMLFAGYCPAPFPVQPA